MMDRKLSGRWHRKDFLRIIAAAGMLGAASKLGLDRFQAPAQVQESRILMGTVVNLTVLGEDRDQAAAAVRACLDRMENLEAVLSRYQPASQLSLLNRTGSLADPHPALIKVIEAGVNLGQQTEGKFDPTVKPLVDLYQRVSRREGKLPDRERIQEALQLVDFRRVILNGGEIRFQQEGMSLTLDGIAKGFIVQEGLEELRRAGFMDQLVEAGGDLAAGGRNQQGGPWKIGVQNPRQGGPACLTYVGVEDQALATSGDYQQHYGEGFSAHHLVDPRRGFSNPELASVTVKAPNAMDADGYATAVMVMGSRQGLALIESLDDLEGLLITKKGQVMASSGFIQKTI